MTFSVAQTSQLLAAIRPARVLKDGKGMSHVSQQDITAHLIRVFGFGNHLIEVLNCECIAQECRNPDAEYRLRKWDVVYKATVRVTILKDHTAEQFETINDRVIAFFEDASCGDAQNQVLHDAHDLAMKSAISLAKKRATINLGDQFGLSLYNKGQMTALVGGTHVMPKIEDVKPADVKDLTENTQQQVSLGTDEGIHDDHLSHQGEPEVTPEQKAMLARTVGATEVPAEPTK